jgi:hypothetical protein
MHVPYNKVPDTAISRLERALPGYNFEELLFVDGGLETFAVFAGASQVATVVAGKDGFEFTFEKDSTRAIWLEEEIEKLCFPNDLKWLLVFPSYESKWGYMGAPAKSKDEALANIGSVVMKQGAMLIGFNADEWHRMKNALSYVHSFQLHGSAENPSIDLTDMGAATIEFTTSELG